MVLENFAYAASRNFTGWLASRGVSLAFTSYQTGRLFVLGHDERGGLVFVQRRFDRCMGLTADAGGERLWMAGLFQLWRFENTLAGGERHEGFDRLYSPRAAYTTGDLDIHDLAVTADGRPLFVNTLYSCLARPAERHAFEPVWRPPFVSRLVPEDRCHLNGLALRDGKAAFVTAACRSDSVGAWRDRQQDGGIVIGVESGEILLEGLSMPHSPRWHEGRLWLLDSGRGNLGWLDPASGRFETAAFLPGYLRGLAFVGPYAVVGSSLPREGQFDRLALAAELKRRDAEPAAGLFVVNTRTGGIEEHVRFHGLVEELYDVVVLPGAARPYLVGLAGEEIRRQHPLQAATS